MVVISTWNVDKSKFIYNGWGKAFDGKGYWSFENDPVRNVVIFGVGKVHHLILIVEKITFLY